jgi:hypothetical protein
MDKNDKIMLGYVWIMSLMATLILGAELSARKASKGQKQANEMVRKCHITIGVK